ncbi:DUF3368 domain-containing protein [Tautonia rosea]|uniref:DUF3368 domain-containing protein n=1 Tax=Tautonia rosea TaxID=2728037 RepID=UPI001473E38A|nr:DUF3368 domain-containing protein [Tautonia rosea]
MIVVTDATPLRYLVFIGEVGVLPALFGTVFTVPEVLAELGRSTSAPLEPVRRWAADPPAWLRVQAPLRVDESLRRHLDPGEAEAIALAQELGADRILLDETRGRRLAKELAEAERIAGRSSWHVAGTLAVLEEAAVRGLIEIEAVIDTLRGTKYRATESIYQQMIERVRERKNG